MKKVGVFEGKTRFSALIADFLKGETTIVTRNGRPVAEIGPVKSTEVERGKTAAMRLEALRSSRPAQYLALALQSEFPLLTGEEHFRKAQRNANIPWNNGS